MVQTGYEPHNAAWSKAGCAHLNRLHRQKFVEDHDASLDHLRPPPCRPKLRTAFKPSFRIPQFEAASIHRIDPKEATGPSGCRTTPGLMRCTNVTLKRCIIGAYAVLPDQVLGGPDWIDIDRFQVTGRSTQPLGDKGLMVMLQALLADRFKLVLRRELRTGETMVLEVAKKRPKLEPAGNVRASWKNMHDHLEAAKMTMGEFAEILSRNLNLPVVDRTGLTGAFNFTLRWNPDEADALPRDEAVARLRSEVSAEIAKQLRLTLKFRKMPIEMLVIDHAAKPSED
jgi:uncharacterized protein (TIGR03435 family)